MSRINKYRGVCIDYQEWVYGDLMQFSDTSIICVGDISKDSHFKGKCHCDVYPETVGQYVGVHDKSRNEVYEGDILRGFQYPFLSDGEFNYFSVVCWIDDVKGFGMYTVKNPKSDVCGISDGNTETFYGFNPDDWEVIGNVYENLDLLKGAGNE